MLVAVVRGVEVGEGLKEVEESMVMMCSGVQGSELVVVMIGTALGEEDDSSSLWFRQDQSR